MLIVVLAVTSVGLGIRRSLGLSTAPSEHWLQTVVAEAKGVIPGERVTAAGQTAGYIASAHVTHRGEAHIVIDIDNSVWPVPRDSTLTLRMSGTVKYTDRYIELGLGHARAVFRNGAAVPSSRFIVPVEYDTLFNTFNAATRTGLSSLLDNAGQALPGAAGPIRRALGDATPALGQTDTVFRDLGYDTAALATLVSASDHVLGAVATANPGLKTLLTGAADTFGAVSSQSTALQQTIQEAPATLIATRATLARADRTVDSAGKLTAGLAPGVIRLRALAEPLTSLLQTVVRVAPDAIDMLDTARAASPRLDSLLAQVRSPLLGRLQSIGRQAARQLDCVRPYTPDILGTVSNWAAFYALGDASGKFLHVANGPDPMISDTPNDSATEGKLLPTVQMDFPQVPGGLVDQPWYQPQCGITSTSFDLADDPEANAFDPLSKSVIQFGSTS